MIEETHDKLGDALLESLASDGEASVESGMTEERGEELSEPIVNAVDETEASQGTKSEKQLSAVAEAAAKGLNPIDDLFFSKMAEDPAVCAEIISTIIRQPIRVLKVVPQNSIINLQGHSVRLDALADIEQEIVTVEAEVTEDCPIGKKGARVNIEVQKSDDDDFERRVLYNAAAVLLNSMPAGEPKYRNMPDVLVILISKFDVFKDGKMVYEIQRVIKGTKKVVYNGMREYYVNTVVRDRSEGWLSDIADLMNIFVDPEAYDSDKFPHFSDRKRYFKETPEGVRELGEAMQEIIDRELGEQRRVFAKMLAEKDEELAKKDAEHVASLMQAGGYTLEEAAGMLGIGDLKALREAVAKLG